MEHMVATTEETTWKDYESTMVEAMAMLHSETKIGVRLMAGAHVPHEMTHSVAQGGLSLLGREA